MDDLFKQLESFEIKGAYQATEWEKLETQMQKKRRRFAFWWLFPGLVFLGSIGFVMAWYVGVNDKNDVDFTDVGKIYVPNRRIITQARYVSSGEQSQALHLINSPNSIHNQVYATSRPKGMNNVIKDRSARQDEKKDVVDLSLHVDVDSNTARNSAANQAIRQNLDLRPKAIEPRAVSSNVTDAFTSTLMFPIPMRPWPHLAVDTSILEFLSEQRPVKELPVPSAISRNLYWGLRGTALNTLATQARTRQSFGLGVLVGFDQQVAPRWSIGLSAGLHSEYRHQLDYTYVADRSVFLTTVERSVKLEMQQLLSANLQTAGFYRWSDRLQTGLGLYYNHILQSRTNVSTTRTGGLTNEQIEQQLQLNYHNLIQPFDFGLYLRQDFRIAQGWGVGLELFAGLNNRLNQNYFPDNSAIRRRELSLILTKQLR